MGIQDGRQDLEFDLLVIGAGPAGIHASVQAAKLGKKVMIVEKSHKHIGGAWLQTGTIPSKTMRETLAAVNAIRAHVGKKWVDRILHEMSMDLLLKRAHQVSNAEEELVRSFLNSNRIILAHGSAFIESPHEVRVNGADGHSVIYRTERILLSCGSRPRRPEQYAFDGWRIVDSDEILRLDHTPRKLAIYGSGVIGCEYACIFQAMGAQVHLIDQRPRVMEYLDNQIVSELESSMRAHGVEFHLGRQITSCQAQGSSVNLKLDNGEALEADVFFFAGGRLPNSDFLGLERLGIELNPRGMVVVNENFQTRVPSIYAAGDIIGPPALASTSSAQGRHAACHMFEAHSRPFPSIYPIGVYTIPELSMVGKTEEQLKQEGTDYVTGIATYKEIARGNIRGDHFGLLKLLICKESQKILGIHIVGEGACNLVHIGMAFMVSGGVAQDLVSMIFNFPTLAEGYRIAAFNALNKIFTDGVIKDAPSVSGAKVVAEPKADAMGMTLRPMKRAL